MTEDFCDKGTKEDPGCQSNCEQPGSGGSRGIFQNLYFKFRFAYLGKVMCRIRSSGTMKLGHMIGSVKGW